MNKLFDFARKQIENASAAAKAAALVGLALFAVVVVYEWTARSISAQNRADPAPLGDRVHADSPAADAAQRASDLLERARRQDDELATKTNQVLDRILGAGVAYVVLNSEWISDETESVKEILDPRNKVVVSETTSKSAPHPNASSTLSPTTASDADDPAPLTSETQRTSLVGKETRRERKSAPRLARLSVALFLEESRKDRVKDLEASVKASVGFDEKRGDTFSSMVTPFAAPSPSSASAHRDGDGLPLAENATGKDVSASDRAAGFWIERAIVPIVAVFALAALLAALWKTARNKAKLASEAKRTSEAALDPRTLDARARNEIQELARTDPERVSSILSSWADQREPAASGRGKFS